MQSNAINASNQMQSSTFYLMSCHTRVWSTISTLYGDQSWVAQVIVDCEREARIAITDLGFR